MKYLNLNILYCTYMLIPIPNILLIINLVTFCSKLSVRKPYIIYLSENCVLVYIRVNISKLLLFRTWKVVIGCYFTADNHFQKCWDTSRFSLKYCKISTPPRLLFNVESWLPHICVGHWYSNIKPNIEWGSGRGGGQTF